MISMLDSTFDFLVRSFKLKTRELPPEEALKLGAELKRFFAVEMNYKGTPIRLIVCASGVPSELVKTSNAAPRSLAAGV